MKKVSFNYFSAVPLCEFVRIMDLVQVGKIAGTQGLDGRLTLRHQLRRADPFRQVTHLFIELRPGRYIPYFIEKQQSLDAETIWVELEELTTVEAARELSGKPVWIEKHLLDNASSSRLPRALIGFEIRDHVLGRLGVIEDMFETPGQVIVAVTYQGREVLIPLVEATLRDIDVVAQRIEVYLPDGLLEVYLNDADRTGDAAS